MTNIPRTDPKNEMKDPLQVRVGSLPGNGKMDYRNRFPQIINILETNHDKGPWSNGGSRASQLQGFDNADTPPFPTRNQIDAIPSIDRAARAPGGGIQEILLFDIIPFLQLIQKKK